jgi:hypothetical protein
VHDQIVCGDTFDVEVAIHPLLEHVVGGKTHRVSNDNSTTNIHFTLHNGIHRQDDLGKDLILIDQGLRVLGNSVEGLNETGIRSCATSHPCWVVGALQTSLFL